MCLPLPSPGHPPPPLSFSLFLLGKHLTNPFKEKGRWARTSHPPDLRPRAGPPDLSPPRCAHPAPPNPAGPTHPCAHPAPPDPMGPHTPELTLQLLDEGPGHPGAAGIKHHVTLRAGTCGGGKGDKSGSQERAQGLSGSLCV